jgi:hypothetical protein
MPARGPLPEISINQRCIAEVDTVWKSSRNMRVTEVVDLPQLWAKCLHLNAVDEYESSFRGAVWD